MNTETMCGDAVHEIGNSSELGSTFPIVLVASEKAMSEKGEAIRAVLNALDRGNHFIIEHWDEAMEICAERPGLSFESQSRCSAFQYCELGFNGTDVLSMNMTAKSMLSFGNIYVLPVIMDYVDLSFLPRD